MIRDGQPARPQCRSPKSDGTPCRITINLSPDGYCLFHDENRREAARATHAAGGASPRKQRTEEEKAAAAWARSCPKEPKTLEDGVKIAAWLVRAKLIGKIDARDCEAVTKALRQFQLGKRELELEDEVQRLKRDLATAKRQLAEKTRA